MDDPEAHWYRVCDDLKVALAAWDAVRKGTAPETPKEWTQKDWENLVERNQNFSNVATAGFCNEVYVAQFHSVSLSTVRRWRETWKDGQKGIGPRPIKFGKTVRYRLTDCQMAG